MGTFGWDLPPGCSMRDIDEAAGVNAICETCGNGVDDCICPECPQCGETGNKICYLPNGGHGLKTSKEQMITLAYRRLKDARQAVADAEEYLMFLTTPDDTEEV